MTNTEAMKLALDALEAFLRFAAIHHDGPDTSDKYLAEDYAVEGFRKARQVLPALRTAIESAEKQEPVAWQGVHDKTDLYYRKPPQADVRPLYTTPPAAPVQEPVALENVYETIIHWDEGGGKRSRRELARRIVALYTIPPAAQRQPLTDEEIDDIWNRYCDEMGEASINDAYDIARAIEAAHGITGEKT